MCKLWGFEKKLNYHFSVPPKWTQWPPQGKTFTMGVGLFISTIIFQTYIKINFTLLLIAFKYKIEKNMS